MSALLVGISVMGLLLSMALPVWSHAARREREAELMFRGEQYARAIELYQRRVAGAFPPDIDTLVEQRFLRRKYRDPMTKDGEFQLILQAQLASAPGAGAATAAAPGQQVDTPAQGLQLGGTGGRGATGFGALEGATPGGVAGGIVGVVSKSTEESIALYNGQSHYNEWAFVYAASTGLPGGVPGAGVGQPITQPGLGNPFGTQPGGGLGQPGGRGGGGLGSPGGRQGGPGRTPAGTQPSRSFGAGR